MNDIITSKKGFFIGDCKRVLDKEAYDIWVDTYFKTGVVSIKDNCFLVDEIKNPGESNGYYSDSMGNQYRLDTGTIAAIPFEILKEQEVWKVATDTTYTLRQAAGLLGGHFFEGIKCDFELKDGRFSILIDNTLVKIIT